MKVKKPTAPIMRVERGGSADAHELTQEPERIDKRREQRAKNAYRQRQKTPWRPSW